MSDTSRLVIIDGHAILHRAFHALPPTLTSPKGEPTNAVYGFTTMLLKVLADLRPEYLIVCFDLPVPTFRMQKYTAYQAKRPEMDGHLKNQVTLVHEMLEALKIVYFEVGGYEADDCIGTLARQATRLPDNQTTGLPKEDGGRVDGRPVDNVHIVTGDRDMLQLVNKNVKVYVPIKGLSETRTYDEKLVQEEFGVRPDQWVDVKALKGDPSDNYPGVSGIGPKTAHELIAKYETLENLFGKLDELVRSGEIKGRTARLLAQGAEQAGLAKSLAKIDCNVPIRLDLTIARVDRIDWEDGVSYMRANLGFKSIPERIEKEYLGIGKREVGNTEGKSKGPEAQDSEQIKLL